MIVMYRVLLIGNPGQPDRYESGIVAGKDEGDCIEQVKKHYVMGWVPEITIRYLETGNCNWVPFECLRDEVELAGWFKET